MPARPCLDCGRLTTRPREPHRGVRCGECAGDYEGKRAYTWAERQRRAAAVAEHRANYGDICSGYRREPHPSSDLTADHVQPVAAGGDENGPLQVLCRPCNSAKAASMEAGADPMVG